ncbi:MAG: hypothetical protein HXS51_01765 [Theionarchaea archaeon]|nr:hypothetical protein [Theionarchaea archaeon]
MKRGYVLIFLIMMIAALTSSHTVESLPYSTARELSINMPKYWHVHECEECPSGYMCRYGQWVPSVYIFPNPIWVFGIRNEQQTGGILNFRPYPDYDCPENCTENLPIVYTAEVVHVNSWDPDFNSEDLPLTYIPPGKYVVTSPSFLIGYNNNIWYFPDDGTGAHHMSAILESDKAKYGREDVTAVLQLQVIDDLTGLCIQVDSVFGSITLPDGTKKTLKIEDWSDTWVWNEEEENYEYPWDFTNDNGECADPEEGVYQANVYVKKKYYQDTTAATAFSVCYHCEITLVFDKDPLEYSTGEPVGMTVTATDENGEPIRTGIDSVLVLPDDTEIIDLVWNEIGPGEYSAAYTPEQEGIHTISVTITETTVCYLEEASGEFEVTPCQKAWAALDIEGIAVDQQVTFTLTVTDDGGLPLSDAVIEGDVQFLNYDPISLTWTETEEGVYEAEFTPSERGLYKIRGIVTAFSENVCFSGSFSEDFVISERYLPDLVIRNEDISIEPEPHLGETVVISVTVWNFGKRDAEDFWVIILIDDVVKYKEHVTVLKPDESVTIEYEWMIVYSGSFVIQAIADPPEGML